MRRSLQVAGLLLCGVTAADPALAQKSGGILKVYHRDSPASMSIHEEGTNSTEIPMMGVMNNLVVFDQHVAQNSTATIKPDLATSWSWVPPARNSPSSCAKGSNGTMASRLLLPMSNAR